jgi:hypothetical protein
MIFKFQDHSSLQNSIIVEDIEQFNKNKNENTLLK